MPSHTYLSMDPDTEALRRTDRAWVQSLLHAEEGGDQKGRESGLSTETDILTGYGAITK